MSFIEKLRKWHPMIIGGCLIAGFDYYVYLGWTWIYEHSYLCIKTSDGLSEVCGVSWDVSPLPAYALTAFAIALTLYYMAILVDRLGLIKWDVI